MIDPGPDDLVAQEREKYQAIWEYEDYRKISPGLDKVGTFMKIMNPPVGSSLIDLGCGDGRAGLEFEKHGLRVWYLDLISNALQPGVDRRHFYEQPLWRHIHRPSAGFDYGYCCDVLEHLPPEYTMLAVARMLDACRTVWMQIALAEETHGRLIGETLHLTVRSYKWWLSHLRTLGEVIDARDLNLRALYVVRSR